MKTTFSFLAVAILLILNPVRRKTPTPVDFRQVMLFTIESQIPLSQRVGGITLWDHYVGKDTLYYTNYPESWEIYSGTPLDYFKDSIIPKEVPEFFDMEPGKKMERSDYIKKYAPIAQREMDRHGIPASITLAQGILESADGGSKLAVRNNNHFGIKCFSRRCSKNHCSNFHDDSHKDFFRIYRSPEESYRAHSTLLKKDRYKSLYKLKPYDYKGWAKGLKKAGYATDPSYDKKLIKLIKENKLYQYDK